MNTDNAAANLRYLLTDDLYLLNADKEGYRNPVAHPELSAAPAEEPVPTASAKVLPASAPDMPAVPKTAIEEMKYAGSNKKHFLVISYYPQEAFMAEAHQKALESTLSRIGYTLDDIALVNKAHYPDVNFARLVKQFSPQKLLVLGSQALIAGLQLNSLNQTQNIGGITALYTFGFDEMMGNKDNTKLFWNQIKTF